MKNNENTEWFLINDLLFLSLFITPNFKITPPGAVRNQIYL